MVDPCHVLQVAITPGSGLSPGWILYSRNTNIDVYPQAGSRYQPVFEIEMVRWYDMGRGGPVLPTTTTRKKPRLQLINLMRSYTDGKIFSFT